MQAGDTIADRFVIERAVAEGGNGRIYRARDQRSGGAVAIKLLARDSERALDRFLRECTVLAEIQHPGVVRYVEHGRAAGGAAYLAMEWLDGVDLAQHLKRGGRRRQLPVAQALALGRRLASAVAELHRRGLVHRDIKPSNVFLPGGVIEHLKLLDLGAVWRDTPDGRFGEREALLGTPHYMAPEQARMNGRISPATDVWGMGCVLYVCLAGVVPFKGTDPVATLARIVVDDPVPVDALREDVPRPLADLVMAALHKDPDERPRDAARLAAALERMGAGGEGRAAGRGRGQTRLTSTERRFTCMLLADAAGEEALDLAALGRLVEASGCELARLAGGGVLVTALDAHVPTDQAARVARAALALGDAHPGLRMVLVTGPTEGAHPAGEAASEAAEALAGVGPGRILVDALTGSLLADGFHLARGPQGMFLGRERRRPRARTVLGKVTPMVGRDRELAALLAAFDGCVGEGRARAVLVTGPAGAGKSRLRDELERALGARGGGVEVLVGRGDMASAGSPFVLLGPVVRRSAGILAGEPLAVARDKLRARVAALVGARQRERVTRFLGELAGVPFPAEGSDALAAARKDPLLMGQLMQGAWEAWLDAMSARGPVVLVLEDLHWGDLPSVRYVDAALARLHDRPLLVLGLARPEVRAGFPRLWEQRELGEIRLGPLPDDAAAGLVRAVLGDVPDARVDALVRRADGNAFFLEELIRGAAEPGGGALPESVLAMVQARLHGLGPEARRVLRAASIFGQVFWEGGVTALLGQGGAFPVHEWLDVLVGREVVVRQAESRIPGEVAYRFRHALVHEAAYGLLTAEDRGLGHGLAGAWLEAAGERDGRIVAEHFLRSREPGRAGPHLARAAEQAMEGNDFEAVLALGARGIEAGVEGAVRGRLRALQAAARCWLGDHAGARAHGTEAVALLEAGSGAWFGAVGTAMVASARLGDFVGVEGLAGAALDAPAGAGVAAEQLVCLCRGTFQLLFHGHWERAERILDRIVALAGRAGRLDAMTRAQVHHLQSLRSALDGDVGSTLRRLTLAIDELERAGDMRNVALERSSLAWWWAELGYVAHATSLCEENLRLCEGQGAQEAITFVKVNLGFILSRAPGRLERARRVLDEAVAESRAMGSARLEGWARVNLAEVAHGLGDHEAGAREGARAVALLEAWPSLHGWALAVLARALLGGGDAAGACEVARRAVEIASRVRLIHGRSLPHLVLARALHGIGDADGARAAIGTAMTELARRVGYLERASWRARFLARPEHRAIVHLARVWTGWDGIEAVSAGAGVC